MPWKIFQAGPSSAVISFKINLFTRTDTQNSQKSFLATTSKINVTPKGVYSLISKLHSILVEANSLANNNKSQICYCGQISLQSAAVNCSFSDSLTLFGVAFILLGMVPMYGTKIWLPTNHFSYQKKKRKSHKYLIEERDPMKCLRKDLGQRRHVEINK